MPQVSLPNHHDVGEEHSLRIKQSTAPRAHFATATVGMWSISDAHRSHATDKHLAVAGIAIPD